MHLTNKTLHPIRLLNGPFVAFAIVLFLNTVISFSSTMAQQYSYSHYDVKDGLAGSSVYYMHQDKEGFIWFATETGLSRFDGTHFKNFTTKDGLPDNTIFRITEDSRGRIWLIPFKNSICYYYKGKIYNQQNDSLLKKLQLDQFVSMVENKNHIILLTDATHLYKINPSNEVQSIQPPIFEPGSIAKISTGDSGNFYVLNTFKLYTTDTKSFTFKFTIPALKAGVERTIIHDRLFCTTEADGVLYVKSDFYKLDYTYKAPPVNTLFSMSDSVICLNTINGTLLFNVVTRTIEKQFLPEKNTCGFLIDREGGYWFSTLNNGVYRLNSTMFKNISSEIIAGQKPAVYDLQQHNGVIWVAGDMGYLQKITRNNVQLIPLSKKAAILKSNAVSTIAIKNKLLAAGCGGEIFYKNASSPFKSATTINATKQIAFKSDTELIVAGSNSLYTFSLNRLKFHNILWSGRTTCMLYRNDTTWFGTLNGLYMLKPDNSAVHMGATNPLLQNRITAIKEAADGTLWVATIGDGVIALKDNRVKWHFSVTNGLASNICRCLSVDSEYVWAGTDKGLSKIDMHTSRVETTYSSSDGLGSDIINTILVSGDTVYVGTSEGISYFNKKHTSSSSICDLKLLGTKVNGNEVTPNNIFNLKYGNNIRFDYVAISYKSAGNILYTYRLRGLDTSYRTTTQTTLEFISLPPGKYVLELIAINKFGVKSNPYEVQILVQPPFWQTAWFTVACIVLSILVTWLIIAQRSRLLRNKVQARRLIQQQLLDLEQKALRAQMNPHFIFNSLNSIQGFILDKDTTAANKYLSQFARLIRQTLDNSFQSQVSVADEIKYLTTYLHLEQMRYRNTFAYQITVDATIIPDQVFIPAMVLQPYVENAIRHGMQNKSSEKGQIIITFSRNNSTLVCSISDNGIGRKEAQVLKTSSGIQYKSRGMQITKERIDLINKNLHTKITVEIKDHTGNEGMAAGTEVIVQFPFLTAKSSE